MKWDIIEVELKPFKSKMASTPIKFFCLSRVLLLGSRGVGKTALCTQVLSSEHTNTFEDTAGKEIRGNHVKNQESLENSVEMEVIVDVDGEEDSLTLIDFPYGEHQVFLVYINSLS